jgi:hypothetical protein
VLASKQGYNVGTANIRVKGGDEITADIVMIANNPPLTPFNPFPLDGSVDQSTEVNLTWLSGDPDIGDIVSYDLYFGSKNPPDSVVASSLLAMTYHVGGLNIDSWYFWRVIAKDNRGGVDSGLVWSFKTTSGLIAYYPFNGNTIDETGHGHNGTVYGAVLTTDRFGNVDRAYSFDGVADYINVADDSGLTLGSGPFVIGAWVKLASYGVDGGYYLMGHSEGPGNTKKWIFWIGSGGISIVVGPTPGWVSLGSHSFAVGQWYHVAIRWVDSELAAFVDGDLIGQVQFAYTVPDPAATFQIGTAEPDRPNRPFRGTIDEVVIFKRAFTDAEMKALGQ